MERFVVTRTRDGLWSVSRQEHTLCLYPAEEPALAPTFKLASQPSQIGHRAVVWMRRAGAGLLTCSRRLRRPFLCPTPRQTLACIRAPAELCCGADFTELSAHSSGCNGRFRVLRVRGAPPRQEFFGGG